MLSRRSLLKLAGLTCIMYPFGVVAGANSKGGTSKKFIITIDEKRCIGCRACVFACQNHHHLHNRQIINVIEKEYGTFPNAGLTISVNRCNRKDYSMCLTATGVPACVSVCPTGALDLKSSIPYKAKADAPSIESLPDGRKERLVHTVCLACNARCGLRVWIRGDEPAFIDGNPYHPYNMAGDPIPYHTPVFKSLKEKASTCSKPQCDIDYLNNPYRILRPLKRNGPRGSGRFIPISWEQLIKEVAYGGKLFAHLGEQRTYPGLNDILSDDPIDLNQPELGPRRNQFVWMSGRSQGGRKQFIKRFVTKAIGSKNYIGHTDICGLGFRMGNWALTDREQVELKADIWNSRYILVFGANIYAALQPGLNTTGAILARRVRNKEVKFVIIDPRAHKATVHAHDWLPIRPGQDGSLALGLLRVLIEEDLFDREFLSLTSKEAAREKGRNVFSNASHLVIMEDGHPLKGRILRLKHLKSTKGHSLLGDEPIVVSPLDYELVPASRCPKGLLEWQGRAKLFDGTKAIVKTAFSLLKESVFEHTLDFYAEKSGISKDKIKEVAKQFSDHSPKSAVLAYHGAGNYVGGAYASYAIALLNALVGSVNLKGGYLPSGGGVGDWQQGLYDLKGFQGALKPKGIKISREKASYEDSSEFKRKGYPSRLPWFPFTKGGLCVSALSGIDARYPYPIKVLFTYFFNPVYTVPGGRCFEKTLSDHEKVPLHVSIDVTVNETNVFSDYIVPDVTYLEGHYGFITPHAPSQLFTGVRTPALKPKTSKTSDGRHFSMENFVIDLAKELGLPGYGENAIRAKHKGSFPLDVPEDFYLRGISNLAYNARVKNANEHEMRFVEANYPVSTKKDILPKDEWARVCTILARGGVFRPSNEAFDKQGNLKKGVRHLMIWNEQLATSKNSLTGQNFWGTTRYISDRDSMGRVVSTQGIKEYPFVLISHKSALHTQSRTICYKKALSLLPEPPLKMNPKDAKRLGLSDGHKVRISSEYFPEGIVARVKFTELVRPGCVTMCFHYGHWQHGASNLMISQAGRTLLGGHDLLLSDGSVKADPARARGINPNIFSRLDDHLGYPLLDILGGIPDFSSTRVRVEPIKPSD